MREIAAERKIRANENAIAASEGEAHGFVVAVSDSYGEPTALNFRFKIQDSEQFHAVCGHGVFIMYDADVPESKGLDQGLNGFVVRDGAMRFC